MATTSSGIINVGTSGMAPLEHNQEATVYVANLDEKVTEAILWELMIQAAPVTHVYIPRDRVTTTHSGYGFAEFETEDDAEYAVRIMNMVKLFGKPIKVQKASSDRDAIDLGALLYVGNLGGEVDERMLYDTFAAFGVMTQPPTVQRDPATGASRGFGFVCFDDFDCADAAIEAMNGQWLANRQVRVSYALKKDGKGERHGSHAERMLAAQAKRQKLGNALAYSSLGGLNVVAGMLGVPTAVTNDGMPPPLPPNAPPLLQPHEGNPAPAVSLIRVVNHVIPPPPPVF